MYLKSFECSQRERIARRFPPPTIQELREAIAKYDGPIIKLQTRKKYNMKKIKKTKVKEMKKPEGVSLKDVYDATPREHRELVFTEEQRKAPKINLLAQTKVEPKVEGNITSA